MEQCTLCPRECAAKRENESGSGFCGAGLMPVVARAALHHWEEPPISGTKGSGTVFFCGCPLGCIYCQNNLISTDAHSGRMLTPLQLAAAFDRLAEQGAHNINLVTATHYLPAIIKALELRKNRLPVVYNTSGYEKEETLRMLEPYVDIYLPDYKYSSPELAAQLSGAPDYPQIALKAIKEMLRQKGRPKYDDNGIMQQGILLRHLVLPGYAAQSVSALDELAAFYPKDAPISLMAQYTPQPGLPAPLNRRLTTLEYNKVLRHAQQLGFENVFIQRPGSATSEYTPDFNLQGVEDL